MAARSFLSWLLRPATLLSLLGLAGLGVLTLTLRQPFYLNILALTLFYAAASSAWNLLGGLAGQLSLGHAAFFGIGAYASTLLYLDHGLSPWWGMLIGGGLASAFAVLVAYPCFRLRGPFFALATIALAEVLRILAMHFRELTKGGVGLSIPFRPGLANFTFPDKTGYAVVAFLFLVVMIGVGYLIKRSRVGYYLAALRDDPEAAEAAGINTTAAKLLVMVVSAFFTALAGTFYAQYVTFIDPDIVFSMNFSVQLALLPIIGGLGTILGPVLGAFILTPLDEIGRASCRERVS
jgi:branched-chain amino acid transport system permease protein